MKTEITIKGQLSSMFTLRNAMSNYEAIITGSFNNYLTLIYPTKKSALKAISEAKKYLRQNDCIINASTTSISYDAGSLYLREVYKFICKPINK
jgi:hypothetical protein